MPRNSKLVSFHRTDPRQGDVRRLVDVAFAGFFLAKWLGKQKSFLDDLATHVPQALIRQPGRLISQFHHCVEEFGIAKTLDLIPNGSNVAVTRENRLQYIQLVSHYRLIGSGAYLRTHHVTANVEGDSMLNQQEVQILLEGVNSPVDLADLRKHTNYDGALAVVVEICSRPPLLGFKELVPNFAIHDASENEQRLLTASTCVNLCLYPFALSILWQFPRYKNERVLREKLLQAIHSGAGFDLS
ncbi:hypothetical protein PILCRDRAFT_689 [Piloderma croceum F 1598]|uniref:HECT-type E3 ubiquitin transferase n=1 Tax=Piloderma croceum (strain F 1598) TaxID=765440 RepID=A0A0C3GIR4_PILCF|nr:hypothetical protein PILCRDRAFT_689 [Piloderma croceum F 1598]